MFQDHPRFSEYQDVYQRRLTTPELRGLPTNPENAPTLECWLKKHPFEHASKDNHPTIWNRTKIMLASKKYYGWRTHRLEVQLHMGDVVALNCAHRTPPSQTPPHAQPGIHAPTNYRRGASTTQFLGRCLDEDADRTSSAFVRTTRCDFGNTGRVESCVDDTDHTELISRCQMAQLEEQLTQSTGGPGLDAQ